MSVNKIIRERRQLLGLSVRRFAALCEVSRTSVQHWEKDGGQAPNRAKQPLVASVLGLTVAELMGTADEVAKSAADLSPRALEVARMFDRISPEMQRGVDAMLVAMQSGIKAAPSSVTKPEAEPAKTPKPARAHKP